MEDVNLIFLLAIPNAEAGSTHMKILTDLTSALVDDDTREAVLKATTAEEIIALLDGEMPKIEAAAEVKKPQTAAPAKTAPAAPATTTARADDEVSFITKILRSISKIFS